MAGVQETFIEHVMNLLEDVVRRVQKMESYESKTISWSRVATATGYTMLATDVYIAVTNTAAARAITILDASTQVAGRIVILKDESGGAAAQNITVTPAAGTIDGAANKVINTNYGVLRLVSNGTNWFTW